MPHEKSTTWKMCNAEKVQHEMSTARKTWYSKIVQNEKSATRKSATRNECNMEQHEKRCNMRRVQHTKKCNMNMVWHKKVQPEKSAIWKSATRIKPNTKWVHYKKKWDMMRVQHKATREKVQHEKSARVKYGKKVHKNSALEWTNGSRAICWWTIIPWCGKLSYFSYFLTLYNY